MTALARKLRYASRELAKGWFMYLLEGGFIVVGLTLLLAQNLRGVPLRYLRALLVAGAAAIVVAGVLGQLRWQMAPAYLVFGLS